MTIFRQAYGWVCYIDCWISILRFLLVLEYSINFSQSIVLRTLSFCVQNGDRKSLKWARPELVVLCARDENIESHYRYIFIS